MSQLEARSAELTHSQTQIWTGQRLHRESPLYNMAFAFVFPAELRTDLFSRAWRRIANESDALRTRLVLERGEKGGARRLLANTAPELEVLDFSSHRDPEREFRRWCRERCARPLPLETGLVESALVRLGGNRTGWYLNQHHLIADAWSTQLLYREVGAEYEALLDAGATGGGERPALHPFYPTEAALGAQARVRHRALEHWAERRRGAAGSNRAVPFYGRHGRPAGTASTRRTLEIGEARSRALEELARQPGFSSLSDELSRFALFATLLVGWCHRISGAEELLFDAPVAGRPTKQAKRALGLFIEMFPFAAAVEPADTFRSLGARCLAESKLFLSHALPGTSAPSAATAGNVVLNYFPTAFGEFAGLPVEVDWVHSGHGDSVHALRLQVHDFAGSGRYTLHFDGNDEALPKRLWERSVEHFERLLAACLDDPDRPIASADIRTEGERQALERLNATDSRPRPTRSVVERFVERARLDSTRVALRQGSTEVSFGNLLSRVEALAATLVEKGVEREDRLALIAGRSIDSVVAILATLRAGAAYVPIDPGYPDRRQQGILEDSGAAWLLAGDTSSFVPETAGVRVLSIREGVGAGRDRVLDREMPALEDLCYVLYTSGSTGRPKGVMIEHAGLADYLEWAERRYLRSERLRFALFTSLSFDLTVTSLFLPLITGGVLEIYPESEGGVDASLVDVVRHNTVDFIKLTPSHLSLFRQLEPVGSKIRRMVVGGEDLESRVAAEAAALLADGAEIHNEYGPTEAVVGCLAHRFDPETDHHHSVPIGAPADHVRIEILDPSQTPLPEGVPGELWISRHGLARGYQGLEEMTAERFPERPDQPGERRYRTGDRVRMVDSTKLEFLGRLDRQIKISGFRVEPAEIEEALRSRPEIEECVVLARPPAGFETTRDSEVRHCVRCGLPSNHPRAILDGEGLCGVCKSYDSVKDYAQAYFRELDDLRRLFEKAGRRRTSEYDCLMLYSGGKDSTYALCRLVEMDLSVYAFTLDNGFISEGAKENIRRVTAELDVPIEFATTPAMNAIFRDSLDRFANVCQGCFKTIYTLSTLKAVELGIPVVVTGLSRGQMFETRLTEEMFRDGRFSPDEVDAAVLAARKAYHRIDDEVLRSLDVEIFQDDRVFEKIRFVDFYRYCDVGLDEMLSYLRKKVPWVRPEDTGRSTNCLINDIGIQVHKAQRGYHNYALPYSWDVRMGHKTREQALAELDDEIDPEHVRKTLTEIGCDADSMTMTERRPVLTAYYVATREVTEQDLRDHLAERLPRALVPARFHRLSSIPLTEHGKLDERALPRVARTGGRAHRAPEGPIEEHVASLWKEQLGVDRVGADDSFFELGGTSLSALEVMIRLCREYDIDLGLETLFSRPTLAMLARAAEDKILEDVSRLSEADRRLLESSSESPEPGNRTPVG